jgi:hypothetical protein
VVSATTFQFQAPARKSSDIDIKDEPEVPGTPLSKAQSWTLRRLLRFCLGSAKGPWNQEKRTKNSAERYRKCELQFQFGQKCAWKLAGDLGWKGN